jgi:hypothetical protein
MAPIRTIWPAIGESWVKDGRSSERFLRQSFGNVNCNRARLFLQLSQNHTALTGPALTMIKKALKRQF